jgi:uncharacterized protein
MNQLTIIVLPSEYGLCRLHPDEAAPLWPVTSSFYSITKTPDEWSVISEVKYVPDGIPCSKGWRLLKIAAVLDLSLTGITAKFSEALAAAQVNLCVIATYDTDYILVQNEKLSTAINALQEAGFIVQSTIN